MNYTHYFKTLQLALAFMHSEFREYEPRGYDTRMRINYDALLDKWIVEVSRLASAD